MLNKKLLLIYILIIELINGQYIDKKMFDKEFELNKKLIKKIKMTLNEKRKINDNLLSNLNIFLSKEENYKIIEENNKKKKIYINIQILRVLNNLAYVIYTENSKGKKTVIKDWIKIKGKIGYCKLEKLNINKNYAIFNCLKNQKIKILINKIK